MSCSDPTPIPGIGGGPDHPGTTPDHPWSRGPGRPDPLGGSDHPGPESRDHPPHDGHRWQPGDPLHTDPRRQHQSGLFTFRHDSDSETCICPDRAQWPTPLLGSAVKGEDELDTFIREWREWRRTHEGAS